MSPEEKLEMGRKLIAEAEAEIAAKKRNWPEKIELGMLFERDGVVFMVGYMNGDPADLSRDLVAIWRDPEKEFPAGTNYGGRWMPDGMFGGKESEFTYLGYACDLIKIADDAHEPTGAELVGKVCQFSDDGEDWTPSAFECGGYNESNGDHRYAQGRVFAWKYARLAR